jgi:hypothetical protein
MSSAPDKPAAGVEHFWLGVLCLLGLDYFSTLAYQPSITFSVAGRLGPLATVVIVLATLFGALPVYCYLAGRSPTGKGSLGLLERLVRGWRGKTLVLVLLGFAATDFIMLKTLSLADAAVHLLHNPEPSWKSTVDHSVESVRDVARGFLDEEWCARCNAQLLATLVIGFISFVFWFVLRRGFNRNVVVLAIPIVGLYMVLNGVIIGGGLWHLWEHPALWNAYVERVQTGDWAINVPPDVTIDGWMIAGMSLLFLPNLALGLSGFELSMILMPQVRGKNIARRIANTRTVLIVAALIMSVFLLGATLVTALYVPPDQMLTGGKAANRALAYLAHGQPLNEEVGTFLPFAGAWFGGLYDVSTILMLAFAGTSVMTALASLLPQFLLKFGMDFRWSQRWGVLLMIFAAINVVVTVHFQASVEQQRNAYATGVLVLIAGASCTSYVDLRIQWRVHRGFFRGLAVWWLFIVAFGFSLVMATIFFHAGGGLAISAFFIAAILGLSVFSRALRADELRTVGFHFKDDESKLLWDSLRLADFPVLIPHRPGRDPREKKEEQIRHEHTLAKDADLVFLEIELDDPSDFFQNLDIEVFREDGRFIIRVTGCASVPHAIAAIALEMSRHSIPPGLHFGWPQLDLLSASWSYLAFGEGNIPWKVRELITRAEPNEAKRPRVIVG